MQKKLQVFVSSTYSDLISERQAAVEAILRAGHIPAGMELFAAGSESQLEIIKRWIDSSDIYMLLLGGRYGSIEPSSGLSYTEIEYRYAVEQGKPYFAVVLSDNYIQQKVKEHGTTIIELAERAKLGAFSEMVKSKISRFADHQSDIRLAVLESMLDIQTRYSLKGWVREDEVPDITELLKQITDLKKEKVGLENQLKVYESVGKDKIGEYTFEELKRVLKGKLLTVPNSITNAGDIQVSAYDLLLLFQGEISLGVENSATSSDTDSYLYFDLCPHLRLYELVEVVKVTSGRVNAFRTSKLGNKFISLANMKGETSTIVVTTFDDKRQQPSSNNEL